MTGSSVKPEWIAVDWGGTHLRVWAMGPKGEVLARRASGDGTGRLTQAKFEAALLALVDDWLDDTRKTPLMACGMVGSRQGWAEAAYLATPCAPPAAEHATCLDAANGRLAVSILPGVKQIKPADVMRGEETQIAGFLAQSPDFDGVLCLPGTHTKWARISAGEIVGFQTFMTGEMFALLAKHSALGLAIAPEGWNEAAYQEAVIDAMDRPAMVAARLFNIRAESLIADMSPVRARARLSGLLVGLELGAARIHWLGQNVAIVGAPKLCEIYASALAAQLVAAPVFDGETMALAGLAAAYQSQKESVQ